MAYRLVVFDFDGTLIDSARCITTSIERALLACGCACDVSGVRQQIGLPLEAILRRASAGIPDAAIADVIAAYRTHYADLEEELIVPFPGACDAVEALHAAGIALAIATNKLTARARMTLDRFDLSRRFAAIVGSDQVANPKPHPDILLRTLADTRFEAASALMVGDTVWDLEMAARAGVASCAVTWGNHGSDLLAGARPTHTVGSFAELRGLVQTIEP